MRRLETASPTSSESSTTEPADEANPVFDRAKLAISFMVSKGQKGEQSTKIKIVNKIVGEALRDASEVPPAIAEFYMKQLSALVWWIATGDKNPDIPFPEDFEV